jgi:hypothetical protein
MTLTSLSDLVSAIAQVSAANIKIQRAGALKAVKAARIIPSADLERWQGWSGYPDVDYTEFNHSST